MAINRNIKVAYGLSEPLPTIFSDPIISNRNPTNRDRAPLGTLWVNKATNDFFILTSVVANVSTWSSQTNGAGIFASLEATAGNITADIGDLVATIGNVTVGGDVLAGGDGDITGNLVVGGNITATAGDITATAGDVVVTAGAISVVMGNITATNGDIEALNGNVAALIGNITANVGNIQALTGNVTAAGDVIGNSVFASGDAGGIALHTGMTNVVNTTQGVGTLAIKSTTGNPGNNTGFLKFYVGATPVFVPYFVTINP